MLILGADKFEKTEQNCLVPYQRILTEKKTPFGPIIEKITMSVSNFNSK